LEKEIEEAQRWIGDLIKNESVNCVHCGETYGRQNMPGDHMSTLFSIHLQHCPKKPGVKKYDSPWLLAALIDSFQHELATTPWGACIPLGLLEKCKAAVQEENK
jgi:hypothetical protein